MYKRAGLKHLCRLMEHLVVPIIKQYGRSMQSDLGELWSMGWPSNVLYDMGVTYQQLKERGLNPAIMQHFNFSLLNESYVNHVCRRSHSAGNAGGFGERASGRTNSG